MNCRVCGRQFDPTGFQIMVPGLVGGFDRVDCALEASALDLSPVRSSDPLPAVVRALPAGPAAAPVLAGVAPATAGAETMRPQLLAGASLALLAAGTAATIYLWLRVFGADAGPLAFPAASASPAFERTTVAASVDLSSAPEVKPQPESAVRGGGSQPAAPAPALAAASASGGGGTLVSNRAKKDKPRNRRNGGPVVRPSVPPPPPAPPAEPAPARSAPVPNYPVPSSPPPSRVPGPSLPGGGGGSNPEQPALPGGGTRG